jgi:uncharacterized membrane protein
MSALLLGAVLSMSGFTELYQPAYKNIKLSGIETVLTEAAGTGNDIIVEDILIEVNEKWYAVHRALIIEGDIENLYDIMHE